LADASETGPGTFDYKPANFVRPTTEQEIIDLVRNSTAVRFFGSGHSFNAGVVSDHTLVSLDDYCGVVWKDLTTENNQVVSRGHPDTRCGEDLCVDGLAFKALPSHDAQSIAGILSTDVHGTGRDWGWVSDLVVGT
jgi:FAD/FMN-containing dehydrogenase